MAITEAVRTAYPEHSLNASASILSLVSAAEDAQPPHRAGVKIHVARNETIFNEGDEAHYVYQVLQGSVRLCRHMADGRRQIADFLLPGDFFGFLQVGAYNFTAEAVSGAVLICYPLSDLEHWDDAAPAMRKQFFTGLSQRFAGMQDHLVMLGRQTARERVASFLVMLAERAGCEDDDLLLNVPMSRQDIADYTGLTIETVCRVLSDMKRARTIGIPNLHQVVLMEMDTLYALAEGES
jgi:CRP-like cAMP-binding protein